MPSNSQVGHIGIDSRDGVLNFLKDSEANRLYACTHQVNPAIAGEDFTFIVASFGDLTCLMDSSWGSVTPPGPGVTWGSCPVEGNRGTLVLEPDGVLTLYTENTDKDE